MSFRCQSCRDAQPPRTSPTRVVTKTRPRTYAWGEKLSYGFDIVEEKVLCSTCALTTPSATSPYAKATVDNPVLLVSVAQLVSDAIYPTIDGATLPPEVIGAPLHAQLRA